MMIRPLQKIVGQTAKPKVKALTQMIPPREEEKKFDNYSSLFVPIPSEMLELEDEEKHYLVPKTLLNVLVTSDDIGDWNYLLERFSKLLDSFNKVLNNVRKISYASIIDGKNFERVVEKRKIKLTEKILEKTTEKDQQKIQAKTSLEDKKKNLELILATAGLMVTQTGPVVVDPLDAATIEDAKASGADLIAAAHLATLEASSPQHVADVMQVILNRAKNQSGGVIAVITAKEQFTPYSAAIYGDSIDKNAAKAYGSLRVTKREIVEIAKTQGVRGLVQRFGGRGSVTVAEQVLQDFRAKGPLSQSSRSFVGGAQYFMGYATKRPGERRRPDGGNFFRDQYASGSIVLPGLINDHIIPYSTTENVNNISNFIVDKPTIIDVEKVGEPLVIIPTERPIGRSILSMIFKEPFRMIDQMFERNKDKKDQEVKAQTPIKNNITSINRTDIPTSSKVLSSSVGGGSKSSMDFTDNLYDPMIEVNVTPSSDHTETAVAEKLPANKVLAAMNYQKKQTNIDSISQKTDNIFGTKVIIMTQDIFVTEE